MANRWEPSAYQQTYNSYSGADIVATMTPLGGKPIVFGSIQTISYSIFRPMTPVFALGKINAQGVTRGQRTIAGSLIFTVFDRHVLQYVVDSYVKNYNPNGSGKAWAGLSASDLRKIQSDIKSDEMPPLTLIA